MPGSGQVGLRIVAIGYLAVVLVAPIAWVLIQAFSDGVAPVWEAINRPAFLHALWLTTLVTLIAVPANAIFGVTAAMCIARRPPGRSALAVIVDLPLALSPVVVGLALILAWGRTGWFGAWLADHGIQIIFSLPAIVLATIIVSLPFVARELVPVLREIGAEQQEAAAVLGATPFQTFCRIVLPALRHGLAYGVVLTTARALGEYGAVAVVSGRIAQRTETLTLHVDERFQAFDLTAAYVAAMVLALMSVVVVVALRLLTSEGEGS
jgi:sulfate/thiosulfate transport system permease protein